MCEVCVLALARQPGRSFGQMFCEDLSSSNMHSHAGWFQSLGWLASFPSSHSATSCAQRRTWRVRQRRRRCCCRMTSATLDQVRLGLDAASSTCMHHSCWRRLCFAIFNVVTSRPPVCASACRRPDYRGLPAGNAAAGAAPAGALASCASLRGHGAKPRLQSQVRVVRH
jgi:hypothetical protein